MCRRFSYRHCPSTHVTDEILDGSLAAASRHRLSPVHPGQDHRPACPPPLRCGGAPPRARQQSAYIARGPLNHPHRDEHTRKRFRGDDIPTGSLRGDTNTAQMRSAVAQCLINEMGVVSEVDSVFFQLGSQLRWPRNPQVRTACPAEGLEAFRPAVEPKPSQPAADRPPARSTAKTIGGVVLSGTAVVRRYSHRGRAYIANWRTTVPPI
jgi:hypothetical protein